MGLRTATSAVSLTDGGRSVEQSPDGALLPICGLPCTYRPPLPSSSGGGDELSGSALFHHQISDDKRWRRGLDFPSSLFISFSAPYAPPPSPPSAPPPPSTRASVGCGGGASTRAHAGRGGGAEHREQRLEVRWG
ncbi:hypothetical protein PVAP13_7NG139126 [Panicum virgatum]|uniref:Uncharacterized protein n=1 Tax=Panicum virgatum TaxID=38727 RepID=A0A8T0PQ34_PANVG|nr:hypothetical protein PVAP13_7NG139126 [Panicum virgatum]